MSPLDQLPPDRLREEVRRIAQCLALARFQALRPDHSEQEWRAWVGSHWREFITPAVDFLIAGLLDAGNRAAAPFN